MTVRTDYCHGKIVQVCVRPSGDGGGGRPTADARATTPTARECVSEEGCAGSWVDIDHIGRSAPRAGCGHAMYLS